MLKMGAVIIKTMGPGADDRVLVSLDVMVLDAVLEPAADIAKMVSLIFFLEIVQILVFNSLLSLVLRFRFATTLLEFRLQSCVFFCGGLDNLGLGLTGACSLSFLHPQVIATTSPAAAGQAYVSGAVLAVAQCFLGLASVSASIARRFCKQSMADQHAMHYLLDLVLVVLCSLHGCKDG
jgi:hypothetical protein